MSILDVTNPPKPPGPPDPFDAVLTRSRINLLSRAAWHVWNGAERTWFSRMVNLNPSERRAIQILENLECGVTWNFSVTPWAYQEAARKVRSI